MTSKQNLSSVKNKISLPEKLPRSFYLRPTLTVAKDLLGKLFVKKFDNKYLVGKIVEVEAYCENDPASHSFRGKTKFNEVMFWEGGHLYVYFTYGMHFCANVVTREKGVGEAVLIRAVEPIKGIDQLIKNRAKKNNSELENWKNGVLTTLTNGPARFCDAFEITRKDNGTDLLGDEIFIVEGDHIRKNQIGISPRIGIKLGTEKMWRFFLKTNKWVSNP